MSAEDKIIEAIDRNTAAVEAQTAWLKVEEDDPLLDVVKDMRDWVRAIFLVICISFALLLTILSAKAAPLVSDGDEIASVGTVQEVRR